jgi:hypothetical protein
VRVEGPCPACRHLTRANAPTITTAFEGGHVSHVTDLTIAIECACGENHPGHPVSPIGCGRSWTVIAQADSGNQVTLSAQEDQYLGEAALAFQAEQAGQAERLRVAGEKWVAGITAILGVTGLVGLGTGFSRADQLSTWAKWMVGGLALAAVIAGGAAVYWAYRAAYGWPVTRTVGTDDELRDWYGAFQEIPRRLAGRLRLSAILAGSAVLLLAAAVYLAALLPSALPTVSSVLITRTDQSTVCGELLTANSDGTVLVRRADDGDVESVPLRKIIHVAVLKNCGDQASG